MATFLRMAGGGLVNADAIEQIVTHDGSAVALFKDGGRVDLADSLDDLTNALCPATMGLLHPLPGSVT